MTRETVLLTATVRPNTGLFVAQADPAVRLLQYRQAISAIRSQLDERVDLVVVETSGEATADLTELLPEKDRAMTRVVSFDPTTSEVDRGKGRVEADAIRFAVEGIIRSSGRDATIHKMTGRLVLENPSQVLLPVLGPVVRVRTTADRSFVDTRLMTGRAQEWLDVILAETTLIDEPAGVYLEHAVAASLARSAALKQIRLERFPVRPRIVGQSGSTGKFYGAGPGRFKRRLIELFEDRLSRLASHKQV